jgi:superoxide reductase
MTNNLEIYKCSICGNIVEILDAKGGTLVCCGQPMNIQKENSNDKASVEKHVPVIEKTKNGYKVKIGSVEHPMLPEHYIQFIELVADKKSYIKFLEPGQKPEAEFCISAEKVIVREFCNLHGLWKSN